MLDTLLSLDTTLLIAARRLIGPEYAWLIQIVGESVVVWCALFLIGLWLYGVKREDNRYKVDAMMIFSTIILTFIVYSVINFGIDKWRPSPQDVVGGIAPLISHPLDNSFPSGHALFTGGFFMGLFFFARKWQLITLTLIIGLATVTARVIGGVHYPGDILGGLIFGSLGGFVFARYVVNTYFFREYIFAPIVAIAKWLHL